MATKHTTRGAGMKPKTTKDNKHKIHQQPQPKPKPNSKQQDANLIIPSREKPEQQEEEKSEKEEPSSSYARALSHLQPIQPVLTGIAHRNHNQHRRAAWWRYFRMLRRHCGKFILGLDSADTAAVKAKSKSKSKSKKRRLDVDADADTDKGEERQKTKAEAEVIKYAIWLRDILIPKCYLAFSQLTADNQFAPLGVVLLGVLASTHTACIDVAPQEPEKEAEEKTQQQVLLSSSSTPGLDDKKGRTISREEVELAQRHRGGGGGRGGDDAIISEKLHPVGDSNPALSGPSNAVIATASGVGRGDRTDDAVAVRPAKKAKTATDKGKESSGTKKDKKDTTKTGKKKTKKRDEFDDLFKDLF